jgi:hypothetical protein
MCAVRLILAQEESYDNEGARTELSTALSGFLHEVPLRGGNAGEWLRALMAHPSTLLRLCAVRVMEVRERYARDDFDFEAMKEEALREISRENDALSREYVEKSM